MLSSHHRRTTTFGSGAHEPYEHALRDPARRLFVVPMSRGSNPVPVEIHRFLAEADDHDRSALSSVRGPVIDLGCGPGRLVREALLGGHLALGIDTSPAAVSIAQEDGLPVLCRSIFAELPAEGEWGTAMLIDGNIGIGGDPVALLLRCARLVLDGGHGRIVVETHPDPTRDRIFDAFLVDDLDRESLPFAWAEVGASALGRYAESAGLVSVRRWDAGGRTFVEYST